MEVLLILLLVGVCALGIFWPKSKRELAAIQAAGDEAEPSRDEGPAGKAPNADAP